MRRGSWLGHSPSGFDARQRLVRENACVVLPHKARLDDAVRANPDEVLADRELVRFAGHFS